MKEIMGEDFPRRHILLDQDSRKKLPQLYTSENQGLEAVAPVKFFTPDSNWTWYATEFDGDDLLFGLVIGHEIELGYFSLEELETIQGPLGLPIERDLYYKPKTLRELMNSHKQERAGIKGALDEKALQQLLEKLSDFADKIGQWDKRIVEIAGIGKLAKKTLTSEDDVQLVCTFNPEPLDYNQAFFAIANILVRNDEEHISEKLGIFHGIDLGFKAGGKICLPNGDLIDMPLDQLRVWPKYNERK